MRSRRIEGTRTENASIHSTVYTTSDHAMTRSKQSLPPHSVVHSETCHTTNSQSSHQTKHSHSPRYILLIIFQTGIKRRGRRDNHTQRRDVSIPISSNPMSEEMTNPLVIPKNIRIKRYIKSELRYAAQGVVERLQARKRGMNRIREKARRRILGCEVKMNTGIEGTYVRPI